MARFTLAWELGAGLGHVEPLSLVARALLDRGHTVDLIWRDLSSATHVLGEHRQHPGLRLWPAPVWLRHPPGLAPTAGTTSYPELLMLGGYLDAAGLLGLVQGWHTLLAATAPDVLVRDPAPSALLAARGRTARTVMLGNGYFQPPIETPFPSFRFWGPTDTTRLHASEAQVLRTCNEVLTRLGQPALPALQALVDVDLSAILTWPELNPYGPDPSGPFQTFGPLPARREGPAPIWPPAGAGLHRQG